MGILDELLQQDNASMVDQLAQKFGVDRKTAEAALRELTPAVARGLQNNARKTKGRGALIEALKRGSHDRKLQDLGSLDLESLTREGDDVLGHVFKKKKVSRNVAKRASKRSGTSNGLMKKMLPVVAMIVMGMLSRKGRSTGFGRSAKSGGLLTSFLDTDGDGSIWDDVLSMAIKFI